MKLQEMAWPEVERVAPQTVAVLPLGSIEQHGKHLAVSVDTAIITALAEATEQRLSDTVILCPTQVYGASDHHLAFPGTLSLRLETYVQVLTELLDSLTQGGFRRIVLLNGHGGNIVPATMAMNILTSRAQRDAGRDTITDKVLTERVASVSPEPNIALATYWELAGASFRGAAPMESPTLLHACEYETSLMLHLYPERVFMNALEATQHADSNEYICWKGRTPFRGVTMSKAMHLLTDTGAIGCPEQANQQKGKYLSTNAVDSITDFVHSFSTWPFL